MPDAFFDWIRFEPDGTGGGGGGAEVVDEFDGSALESPPWAVVRQTQDLAVSGGALRIPAAQGDIYGAGGNANNLVLRDAPAGAWEAITKVSFEGTAQYHQAGLIVYGDDDNFTKFGRIAHTAAGDEKFEFIYEDAGVPRNEAADSTANLAAGFPHDFFLRITSDGTNLTGAYSTDGASVDARRTPGAAARERQGRDVRLQQPGGHLARGGLRLLPADERQRRRRRPSRPEPRRPVRRLLARHDAAGTRSSATTRAPTRSAAAS